MIRAWTLNRAISSISLRRCFATASKVQTAKAGKQTAKAATPPSSSDPSSNTFLDSAEAIFKAQRTQKAKVEKTNEELLRTLNDEKLLKKGVYKHPYCTDEYPLALESRHLMRIMMDLVGPEQVSPHYQSLEEYGKWFTYFLISFGFCFTMRDNFNHAFGYCMTNMVMGAEIYLYMSFYYILRNNVMSIPNPWKTLWIRYNMDQMLQNLYEDLENLAVDRQKEPLQQVDYYRLHKEFLGMKAKLLNHHLKVSKQQLKKHAYERVNAMLKMVEQFENENFKKEFNNLLTESVENVYRELKGGSGAQIRKQAFESALIGIKNGKMSYEKDPILPLVLKNIEDFEKKVKTMSKEELVKLVQLKNEQKAAIREQDKSRENAFLVTPPPIKHPRILTSPKFKVFAHH